MATFLRTRSTFTLAGMSSPALITAYWDSTGAAVGLLATEAVARVRACFNAMNAILIAGSLYSPSLIVDEIEETTGAIVNQVTAGAPGAIAFTGTGDPLPYQTQGLLGFGTATFISGRRLKGRMFIPGFGELSSAGAPPVPSAAAITAMNNGAAALGTTILTATNQRVWSRPQPGRPGLSAPVTTRSISPVWAVLKSRRS
jgi:hypothetical protein